MSIINVYMRTSLSGIFKKSKGFTLIELLIVIAILGILAVAVLSAINPVEQINRGRDTGTQSDAEQLLSAISRYNASNGYFPWQTGASDTTNLTTGWTKVANGAVAPNGWEIDNAVHAADPASPPPIAGNDVLSVLGSTSTIASQELQQSYIARITGTGYNFLYVYNRGTSGDSTYVCFKPQSGQFAQAALTRCTGTLPADYPGTIGAGIGACNNGTPTKITVYTCLP